MTKQRLRVGIVGMTPGRSWSAIAHLPALQALAEDFEVVGVANSTQESGEAAAKACGLPRAFKNAAELITSPDVDIVAVNVKAPHHRTMVTAAIEARKAIYCEWPLGVDLAQSRELAKMARDAGVMAVCGTQGRGSIELGHVAKRIREGYIGRPLSISFVGTSTVGAPRIIAAYEYSLDKRNGASMLMLTVGHTLATIQEMFGPLTEVSALLATRQPFSTLIETGQSVAKNSEDQVMLHGLLPDGLPLSLHYRTALGASAGLFWQIQGDEGMIQITAANGHTQNAVLNIQGTRGDEPLHELPTPPELMAGWPVEPIPRNVARIYAQMAEDIRTGSRSAPSFDDAVELQRLLAAIDKSGATGCRVALKDV
jgi:predicted dehydrogenase